MSGARFRYALQPVLLTRQWALDALMLTLSQHNADIAAHAALQTATRASHAAASEEWRLMGGQGQAHSVERFSLAMRYLSDLARQMREQEARMNQLQAARDAVVAEVVLAQRAVEAAEQHRDEMKAQFIQLRLSADFRLADDQWNTLQAGAQAHDH